MQTVLRKEYKVKELYANDSIETEIEYKLKHVFSHLL